MSTFLTAPLAAAETALAAQEIFRTWCGATSEADAKANYIFSDDSAGAAGLPQKYVAISAVDFQISRVADGSGFASFALSDLQFEMIFSEDLDDGEDWSNTLRTAFKDAIAGFIPEFMNGFESAGQALESVRSKKYSQEFRMHTLDHSEGIFGYQMGFLVTVSTA